MKTIFQTENAEKIVEMLNRDSQEDPLEERWSYSVVQLADTGRAKIVVRDEEGIEVGEL